MLNELVENASQEIDKVMGSLRFKVFECSNEVVRFEGTEFDLIIAFEVLRSYGLNPFEAKRVYRRVPVYKNDNTPEVEEIGESWEAPFNEITFIYTET